LTAGHCVRVLAPEDMSVVFNYHYAEPGKLAVREGDVEDVIEIVHEALDPPGIEPRLDYAWIRLAAPARPPKRPVPIYAEPPPSALGDPIVTIGAGGGVPIKLDAGGRVRDLRERWSDYFMADIDTSRGSSGAGAFTPDFVLLGILARGGLDFEQRGGCNVTRHTTEEYAEEQITYAHRAVTGLCRTNPHASSLCRTQCGEPCQALALPGLPTSGACSVAAGARDSHLRLSAPLAMSLAWTFGLRRVARSRQRRLKAGFG